MPTNGTAMNALSTESWIVAYYSLILMIVGTIFNLLTLVVLCQSTFRNGKNRGTLYYMRTIAIFDILMLYGWNLDHFVYPVYGFTLLKYSIPSCKFISFISYFTPQTSAYLRVFICIDRYFSLSGLHRVWIHRSKNILIIIVCIITIAILLNLHILIFVCFTRKNGAIAIDAVSYQLYPMWDYVNLGVYNCLPFLLMVTFNSGIIYHLIRLRRTTTIRQSHLQHRSITITLIITTFLFLIMTIPATVAYAYFIQTNSTVLRLLDGILYTYHIASFPLYMITLHKFRRACIAMFTGKNHHRRVQPQMQN